MKYELVHLTQFRAYMATNEGDKRVDWNVDQGLNFFFSQDHSGF